MYVPAEISIANFSLQDGVNPNDVFHVILDSGTSDSSFVLGLLVCARYFWFCSFTDRISTRSRATINGNSWYPGSTT